MGTAFSGQKNDQKAASFSAEIYTAEDQLEEERYIREERAGIEDDDSFEDVPK
jgi:hypothetical protein